MVRSRGECVLAGEVEAVKASNKRRGEDCGSSSSALVCASSSSIMRLEGLASADVEADAPSRGASYSVDSGPAGWVRGVAAPDENGDGSKLMLLLASDDDDDGVRRVLFGDEDDDAATRYGSSGSGSRGLRSELCML